MRLRKQYTRSWIAYFAVIIAATVLLLLAWNPAGEMDGVLLTSVIAWVIIAASTIVLFMSASRRALAHRISRLEQVETGISRSRAGRTTVKDGEQLDIQAVAGKITRRVDPADDPEKWGAQLLGMLVNEIEIMSGVVYKKGRGGSFTSMATYALPHAEAPYTFKEGEGLTGQAVKNGQVVVYRNIPEAYGNVFSGLGAGKPAYLALVPMESAGKIDTVVEVAGYRWSASNLEQLFQLIARDLSAKKRPSRKSKPEYQQ